MLNIRAQEPPVALVSADAGEAATAAQQRLLRQEEELLTLRQATERQRAAIVDLQRKLGAAEASARWLPLLAAALILSAGILVWLALRNRALQDEHQSVLPGQDVAGHGAAEPGSAAASWSSGPSAAAGWAGSSGGLASAPGGLTPMAPLSGATLAALSGGAPTPSKADMSTRTVAAAARSPMPLGEQTDASLMLSTVAPREVSVEELLDLEQQVDFFIVLGQHEAAVDLLMAHIRSTGGTSPLAYLKLMEIYVAQNHAEGYTRIQGRFNKRFSALAPDWGGDLHGGRVLEDYPDVMQSLQRVWAQSERAMHDIDRLMRLPTAVCLFDLPAFRELLLLHGVAGDLMAHPRPAHPQDVDLLLPLDRLHDEGETTAPQPRLAGASTFGAMNALLESVKRAPLRAADDAPDSTFGPAVRRLDLDLSEYAPAPREFTEPAAFTDLDAFRQARRVQAADVAEAADAADAADKRDAATAVVSAAGSADAVRPEEAAAVAAPLEAQDASAEEAPLTLRSWPTAELPVAALPAHPLPGLGLPPGAAANGSAPGVASRF